MPATTLTSYPISGIVQAMNPFIQRGGTVALAILAGLGWARLMDCAAAQIFENEDDVGYFLANLPSCPDYVPEWMDG